MKKSAWLFALLGFLGVIAVAQIVGFEAPEDAPAADAPAVAVDPIRAAAIEQPAPPQVAPTASRKHLNSSSVARELSTALADTYEKVVPSVVTIRTRAVKVGQDWLSMRRYYYDTQVGQGSGVIIDKRGHIITNNHVLQGAERVKVELSDGRSYDADFIGSNAQTDIAVLLLRAETNETFTPAEFADSDLIRVGEMVLAIGAPYALQSTVTQGIISQKGRPWQEMPLVDFLQTSAAINPGNSGGALVDIDGQLVGINTFIHTARDGDAGSIGLGFAVPSKIVQRVAQLIIENKQSDLAWLGVRLAPDDYGVFIRGVEAHSPALLAGVKAGDLVISVDQRPIRSNDELRTYMTLKTPGDTVELVVLRDREEVQLAVKTAVMPDLKTLYKNN